jgi:hypothetical protein
MAICFIPTATFCQALFVAFAVALQTEFFFAVVEFEVYGIALFGLVAFAVIHVITALPGEAVLVALVISFELELSL